MATDGTSYNGHTNNLLGQDGHLPLHSFDPDAPPSEKAAIAGRERDKLNGVTQKQEPGGQELKLEGGGSVVPTIMIQDIDEEKEKEITAKEVPKEEPNEKTADSLPPLSPTASVGEFPTAPAPAIPDWYRIGWRQVSGIDAPVPEGEEKDRSVLDMFISEQYYGTWYHNAGIIIFAVVSTHFLTLFRAGWGWLFIVLSVCSTYYTISVRRVRRIARDEIQRELVKSRLESEHEPAEWLNNFLDRFWLMYEPVLSASIVASVDPILIASTPTFLDSLRLTHFTLGAKAPHIDKVRTFPKTEDDVVMMDLSLSFTPKDTSNMTPEQRASKDNMKIVLSVRVGKGLATAAMPILVENLTFSGILRIRMKLMSNWPHVQMIDLSFMEKPFIDYILKPIGGDTFGFDIANIPGLSTFIRDMTHGTLQPMMYHPNLFTLNLEQMMSGVPLDTACGIIQVVVQSARGIKGTKIGGGTPDPYVGLAINNQKELARTRYKNNTHNPTWQETKFLLVHDLNGSLNLNLWDFNDHRKDTLLGSATFELHQLLDDATQDGLTTPILKDGKERGEMRYDVTYYPVLQPEEGTKEVPDTPVGIARITIHQAKELDASSTLSGDLNPFVRLYVGDTKKPAYTTTIFKHTKSPTWETSYEFLCSDRENTVIIAKVVDDRDFLKDPIVGYMSIKLQDLLDSMAEPRQDWFPLSHCKSGKIRLSAMWKPLSISGSLHGAEKYTPPIGVVRLLLDKATDVKNVEATLGGKSDPYIRVQINNVTQGRTEVINNNLNPVWDQIVYIPVHSLKEILILECMDYQHLTKDRPLGSVELLVSDLAETSDDLRYPHKSKGIKDAEEGLRLEGTKYHGSLHYVANFIPAVMLKDFKFSVQRHGLQRETEELQDEEGGYVETGSVGSDDGHKVDGVTIKLNRRRSMAGVRVESVPDAPEVTQNGAQNGTNGADESGSTASSDKEAPPKKEEPGVEMSVEDLLKQQSGIVVFNVISGSLTKKARLEVLLDDGYWPCFSTHKPRSVHADWQYVGEGFVKEIDFSQVWLRLNDAPEGDKDDVIAQWKGETKHFLEETLKGPQTYTLVNPDTEARSTVVIEARYIPVPVQLQPRESINNQGLLRVELIDGQEIRGVDRGGKSDPYVVFSLNGQKVHKSQTKKKTLTPEWDEDFTCLVPSRVAAEFTAEVFDWNQIEQAKSLGVGTINLADLEPFQAADRIIPLKTTKHGEKGHIRIRLVFQPEIIAKTRKNTSTFTSAGRAMTQIGVLPVTAGRGVFQGVTSVFKSKPKDDHDDDGSIVSVGSDLPAGQASQPIQPNAPPGVPAHAQHVAASAPLAAFPSSEQVHLTNEPGTLRVTVLDAKDLPPEYKPYAVLRLGDKEVKTKHTGKTGTPEWNESFNFYAGPGQAKLHIWIHDHKTLGRDKLLGEGEVDIWRHVKPEGISAADVFLELRNGSGRVQLKLEYDANLHPSASNGSTHSGERMTRTTSMTSPSRFSLRGRRPGSDDD
ncbi:tricalbin [Pluteus cervinus]|uniref:Tricalbin n=1 Tax=Pluteus cervinus TaxID=181527 RepID=A0ACD3BGN5_9AGAR|nr:tricalbin [Pluteus cervinus]